MLKSHGRYPYTPITQKAAATWPNGAHLAVYFALGVEEYVFGEGMTENIIAGTPQPDFTNTSWRDYGNRVGGFRILERFQQSGIPLSVLLNTAVYDHAPALMSALSAAGCPMIGHGISNSHSLATMSEDEERAYLGAVSAAIASAEGGPPQGWSSPWLSHTELSFDLIKETGYRYVLDLGLDDRPVWLTTRSGPLLHIPYALELNDSSTEIGRDASGRDFEAMIVDQFDEMLENAASPIVMSVVIHSFITGQPFRLRALTRALQHIIERRSQIWLTTPDDIASAVADNPKLAVP